MEFNATFLITILTFIIFVFLMNMVLYSPVLRIMKKRELLINHNYKRAQRHNKRADNIDIQRDEIIKNAKSEASEIIKTTSLEAKTKQDENVKAVKQEAQKQIEKNKADLLAEVSVAKKEIKTEINSMVQKIISKILNEDIQINIEEEKINKYLDIK